MSFIKVQKLVLSEDGKVLSGSAAIVDTIYDSSVKGRSRHKVREKLGKGRNCLRRQEMRNLPFPYKGPCRI